MQLLTHFRAAFGSPFSIQRIRFLWARMCFGTNYSTTEYEHDISPFYWKSTYYKQGLFVDSTPEYGVRTVGFHILLYINTIPKQHVRSTVTLNVTSGVVNALGCVLGISNICHRTGTGYADVRGCHGDELEPFAFANLQNCSAVSPVLPVSPVLQTLLQTVPRKSYQTLLYANGL